MDNTVRQMILYGIVLISFAFARMKLTEEDLQSIRRLSADAYSSDESIWMDGKGLLDSLSGNHEL